MRCQVRANRIFVRDGGHHQVGDLRPCRPLYRSKTDDAAIKMANDTESGLAAYYSRDIGRIWRNAEGLEYRIVGINEAYLDRDRAFWQHERERRRLMPE